MPSSTISGRPCRSACDASTSAPRPGHGDRPERGRTRDARRLTSAELGTGRAAARARRSRRAKLRLLLDDDHLLTVHLDGAPVGGRVALRLGGAVLAPLAQLLL